VAHEPRRHNLGVVDDDKVAGAEQIGQVADRPMGKRAVGPIHDEQPRGGPVGKRLLRDQLRRQVVGVGIGGVRVGLVHARHRSVGLVEWRE